MQWRMTAPLRAQGPGSNSNLSLSQWVKDIQACCCREGRCCGTAGGSGHGSRGWEAHTCVPHQNGCMASSLRTSQLHIRVVHCLEKLPVLECGL